MYSSGEQEMHEVDKKMGGAFKCLKAWEVYKERCLYGLLEMTSWHTCDKYHVSQYTKYVQIIYRNR